MKDIDKLRDLLRNFFYRENLKARKMKRVFQWSRYIEWKDLTQEEKINAKRILLIPLFAYLILIFFNQNFFLIVLLLIGYVLYKKFEKGHITKK